MIILMIVGFIVSVAYFASIVEYGDKPWKALIAIAVAILCAVGIPYQVQNGYAEYQKEQQQRAYYAEHKKEILLKELDELERQEAYNKYMNEASETFNREWSLEYNGNK